MLVLDGLIQHKGINFDTGKPVQLVSLWPHTTVGMLYGKACSVMTEGVQRIWVSKSGPAAYCNEIINPLIAHVNVHSVEGGVIGNYHKCTSGNYYVKAFNLSSIHAIVDNKRDAEIACRELFEYGLKTGGAQHRTAYTLGSEGVDFLAHIHNSNWHVDDEDFMAMVMLHACGAQHKFGTSEWHTRSFVMMFRLSDHTFWWRRKTDINWSFGGYTVSDLTVAMGHRLVVCRNDRLSQHYKRYLSKFMENQ